jgi:thiamine biosynthesis lipoprotein ApbE
MKKLVLLVAVGALGLASCTKDYTCKCTEKDVVGTSVDISEYTYQVLGANSTQAQAACNEATIKVEQTNYTYERTCELSKK